MMDPSPFQAWLIAIPSAITALSTWYINHKTAKTSEKSHTITKQFVADNASELKVTLDDLEVRVTRMEEMLKTTKDCQLLMAQKHAETMALVNEELKTTKATLARVFPAPAVSAAPPVTPDTGKVVMVETAIPSIGKVIRKP